eukprot:11224955-Karenia_brevis.AAC.1
MDPSLLHRVPEQDVNPAPVEYVLACCNRCETPLCLEAPAPGSPTLTCGACGMVDPKSLPKSLTVQSGQMYHVEVLIIDDPQQMQVDAANSDVPSDSQHEEIPGDDQGIADAPDAPSRPASSGDVPGMPSASVAEVPDEP